MRSVFRVSARRWCAALCAQLTLPHELTVLGNRRCPVCEAQTANPFTSLIWPRCKVCRSKFRLRLPFGVGFIGDYIGYVVLLGSLVAAVVLANSWVFAVGLALFAALEIVIFRVSRLEPDARDPVTAMQLRRYKRG